MTTRHPGSGGRGPLAFPMIGDLVSRVPGGRRYVAGGGLALAILIIAIVAIGVSRGRRVADWAPLNVVESTEPLQELPVRIADRGEPVPPAQTYDAVLDFSSIRTLVVGVDLDYVPVGSARYDAVIRNDDGTERFREPIADSYFTDGRFMLRLQGRRLQAGDYTLDIEAFEAGSTDGRIVASSWFQLLR